MKKININRQLFTIHSWLGLCLGLIFMLISISGASIVFMHELNQLLYSNKIKIETSNKPKLSFDRLYNIASKEYPNAGFVGISIDPSHPNNAYSIIGVEQTPEGLFATNRWNNDYIDPYTGKIIFRTNSSGTGNILAWLDNLHASLRLGTGGVFIVTIMSIAVLLSLITGLIFYRKYILKVLQFKMKIKFKNWRTASSDMHRIFGTWALIINLLIFGSGLYMYYPLLTPSWWIENWPPKPEIIKIETIPSLDNLINKAKNEFPKISITYIGIPRDGSKTINIGGLMNEKLFMDVDNSANISFDYEGNIKEMSYKKWNEYTTLEKFENINFNVLHTGWALGLIGKILWTIFGFAPAFLSITGFLLWWRRFKN